MTEEGDLSQLDGIIAGLDTSFIDEKKYCDHCIGRLFAKVGTDIPNEARGKKAREILGKKETPTFECQMCMGVCGGFDFYADLAVDRLKEYEASSFLIGSRFDAHAVEEEETLWSMVSGELSEPIKAEFNREVGKMVFEKTGLEVSFDKPDITIQIDTMYDSLELQFAPLHIYGRYRKLVRGIPQTRWPCRSCRGKGCDRCSDTGKMYQTSVEEVIGAEVMKRSGGKDHRFHGMGREDVDALMLGEGRPFVLEVKEPVKRTLPLEDIAAAVNGADNGVEVNSLRPSDGKEVVAVKSARPRKKYRVLVRFDGETIEAKLKEVVLSLGGKTLAQQTPTRVSHRRADKTRSRVVESLELKSFSMPRAELELTAEAGTYVKEFIHGDGGRTVPSLAGQLEIACEVEELDVLEIMDERE